MLIALAVILFILGMLWHFWRLSLSDGSAGPVRRIVEAAVGAALLAFATVLALKGLMSLPVSFWSVLPLFLIYLLFIDAAHSARRFNAEDFGES